MIKIGDYVFNNDNLINQALTHSSYSQDNYERLEFLGDAVLQILLLLPAAVLAIVGLYQEYEGHIAALYGVNDVLAQKWSALWKWELTFLLLALGGGLFALLIPIIAALAVLVGAIGSFVVSIKRLIYLYQSAKTFREYIQDGAEPYALP